jgi:hypothetical protein
MILENIDDVLVNQEVNPLDIGTEINTDHEIFKSNKEWIEELKEIGIKFQIDVKSIVISTIITGVIILFICLLFILLKIKKARYRKNIISRFFSMDSLDMMESKKRESKIQHRKRQKKGNIRRKMRNRKSRATSRTKLAGEGVLLHDNEV